MNGVQVALVDDTGTQDEATYFVHNDHLGTPQKITDDTQAVVWGASYEPFGEVTETTSVIENNIRFPGQYEDGETGLSYNYFRDYDASLGRYVESDPIGLEGGVNTYAYVSADPINRTDARGLASCDCRPMGGGFRVGQVKICRYNCKCACPNDSSKEVRFTIKYSQGTGGSEMCFGQSESMDGHGRPVPLFGEFPVNTTAMFSRSSSIGFRAKMDARVKVECKDCT